MADPARYYVDAYTDCDGDYNMAKLVVTRSASGEWIKWSDFKDYKAAQRRNASYDTNVKLGMEVAELRCELQDLKSCVKNLQDAAIVLMAERDRLKSQLTPASDCSSKP